MKKTKNQVSKTTKKLFRQVSDLIDTKLNQATKNAQLSQRNISRARIFGSEINFGTDPSISLSINTINDFLNQISLTPIIIDGLIITQNTPADSYVNISSGTALYAGKVFELQSDISNLEIPLSDNPNTTIFYIQLTNVSGGYANVSVNTSELIDSCTIGAVRIPVAGDAEDVIDQKDYDNTADSAYIDNRQQIVIYDDGLGKLQETSIDFFRNNDNISDILVDNDILGIWFKDVNDVSRGYIRGGTSTLNYSAVNRHWFTGAEVYIGDDEAGLDFVVYGDNSGQKMFWDASENSLFMYGDLIMKSFEEGDEDNESSYDIKFDFISSETGHDSQKIWAVYDAYQSNYALYLQADYRLEWWCTKDRDSSGNRGIAFQSGGDSGVGAVISHGAWWTPNTENNDYVVGKPVDSKGGVKYWNEGYINRVIFNDSGEEDGTAERKAYIDGASEGYLDYYVYTAHRFNMVSADTDVRLEFVGTTNSGLLEWMEDEDYFKFSDDIFLNSTGFLYFRDTYTNISSADANHLDIVAPTYLDFTINSVETSIASVSTGTGDNDKLVTQGYVDDAVEAENLWDRTDTTLSPHTANDNVDLGSGTFLTTGTLGAGAITGTSLTDGTATLDDGALSGVTTIGMNNQLTNSLADGTAPFVITSTTVNTNLNADLWDGYQFADYLDQAVKQASSPTFVGLTLTGAIATPTTITTSGLITSGGNLIVDGGDIGLTADTDLIQIASDSVTVNGALTTTGLNTWGTGTYSDLGRFANQDETPAILYGNRGASGSYITSEEPFLRYQHWVQTSVGSGGTPPGNHRLGYDFETIMGASQTGHYTGLMHYGLNYGPNRGDFVSIGSQILAMGDRTDAGSGTGGDTGWAFWGHVWNNGYNAGGVAAELDCVNTNADMLDDGSSPCMTGIRLSTEYSTYHCTRAIKIVDNFNDDKGWDVGIDLAGWNTTGIKFTRPSYGSYDAIDMNGTDIVDIRNLTFNTDTTFTLNTELRLDSANGNQYAFDIDNSSVSNLDAAACNINLKGGTDATGQDCGFHLRDEQSNIDWCWFIDHSDSSNMKIDRETTNLLKFTDSTTYLYQPVYIADAGLIYNYRDAGAPGSVGYRFYNGGQIAEWEIRQPSSSDHNFYISKKVGANYSNYFKIGTDGKTYFYGDSDFGDFDITTAGTLASGDYTVTGDINPEADGTRDLGTQTTRQWANVWADLVNGSDYSMLNDWRILEAEKYEGYPKGIAIGNTHFKAGVVTEKMPTDAKPIFAVTETFIEFQGIRLTKEDFKKIKELQ